MDRNQKLAEIESIINQISDVLARVLDLSKDTDDEVRYRALECFDLIGIPEVFARVRESLYDSDELVRIASLELLGEMQDDRSAREIESLLNDESPLVRGAAAISLGDIGGARASDKLLSHLSVEDDDEVRVPIYAALYALGQEVYLEKLLEGLNNEYYRVRCASANLLVNIANTYNKPKILEALTVASQKEETAAASSSINSAISSLISDLAK